jgi:hypothetical protein
MIHTNKTKLSLALLAAFVVAIFTTTLSSQAAPQKIGVAINSEYDFGGGYPFPGTFTMSVDGVVVAAGTVTMEVGSNENGMRFHCLYRFTPTSGPAGTFIIREQCAFAPEPDRGRWEIVSGTGAYENVKGNGSALMPGNQENWIGSLY